MPSTHFSLTDFLAFTPERWLACTLRGEPWPALSIMWRLRTWIAKAFIKPSARPSLPNSWPQAEQRGLRGLKVSTRNVGVSLFMFASCHKNPVCVNVNAGGRGKMSASSPFWRKRLRHAFLSPIICAAKVPSTSRLIFARIWLQAGPNASE